MNAYSTLKTLKLNSSKKCYYVCLGESAAFLEQLISYTKILVIFQWYTIELKVTVQFETEGNGQNVFAIWTDQM